MAKEVVNLKKSGSMYKVESLTNRIEPMVGSHLKKDEVEELLELARNRRPEHPLTVNIK